MCLSICKKPFGTGLFLIVFGLLLRAPAHLAADEPKEPDDKRLLAQWEKMAPQEVDAVVLRNFSGLVRAAHAYHDLHQALPPAVVPNPDLPPEKRLSGFVLLLPHFAKATRLARGKEKELLFDEQTIKLAEELFRTIDLKKAWDDPANLKAAKTLMPVLIVPGTAEVRNVEGYAVSHVAFIRGARGNDDGAFSDATDVTIDRGKNRISDGTAKTLAFGQISAGLGPWTAAGPMTSRWMYHPSEPVSKETFGTVDMQAIYAANCDGFPYVLDLKESSPDSLAALAGKSDSEQVVRNALGMYRSMVEWQSKR